MVCLLRTWFHGPSKPGDLPPYSAVGAGGNEPKQVSPSLTCQGTTFGGGPAPTQAGQYPLQRLPMRVGPEGQTAGYYCTHPPISSSDWLNRKNSVPSYRDDSAKMIDLVMTVFATLHLNGSDIQAWLNIFLRGVGRLVLDKTNEETQRLHQEHPCGTPDPTKAMPLTESNWDPNENVLLS